jgi:hypothetical protein
MLRYRLDRRHADPECLSWLGRHGSFARQHSDTDDCAGPQSRLLQEEMARVKEQIRVDVRIEMSEDALALLRQQQREHDAVAQQVRRYLNRNDTQRSAPDR